MERSVKSLTALRSPWLLLLSNDTTSMAPLTRGLAAGNIRTVFSNTPCQARQMLRDVIYSGSSCDGVLVDYMPPDAETFRILEDFRDEFWDVPLALMIGFEVMSPEIGSWSRHIPIFRKPLQMDDLQYWLTLTRKSARAS